MSYTPVGWKDYPEKTTPMSARNLGIMETGIINNDAAITELQELVATQAEEIEELKEENSALNNAKVIYNEETDALDVYANGILVGSLECNFQIYPIDFIADTINTDWTIDSGNKLTIGTTFKTTSNAVSAKYVTFNEPIKISEGAVLNIVGNLYLGAGTMPGTTIYGYHNVQISKDGGVTWDTINSATLNMKSVYNTSGAVSKAINLDAYAGYDILLRICTYHTRTDDASGTWYDVTLTQFDITYP